MKKLRYYLSSLWRTRALAGVLLCALTLMATFSVTGCTQAQKITVAQEIVNWMPAATSAVNTISATVAMLDPASAIVLGVSTAGFDVVSNGLQSIAKDYLANPNQSNLELLQAEVIKFQQSVNASLLQVAGIKNQNSQKLALASVNALATIVNTILALVQQISTKAQLAQMASQVHITLADVRVHMDEAALFQASQRVTTDLAWPISAAPTPAKFFAYEASTGF